MNHIESNVTYLRQFSQVLLGSIIKNANAKLQDTGLWISKKKRNTNVWSLGLGEKIKILSFEKMQARALGGIFSLVTNKICTKKNHLSWYESDLKKSLKYKKSENKGLKYRFGRKNYKNIFF